MIDVGAAAAAYLDLIVDTAAAADPAVALPARQYVTAGLAGAEAWDCDQVTVGLVQFGSNLAVAQADAAGRSGNGDAVPLPSATFAAEIVRGYPAIDDYDGDWPPAAALHEAGLAAMRDVALLNVVRVRIMAEAALTGGRPGDVRAGPVVPAGPEGKYAATRLTVAVSLW